MLSPKERSPTKTYGAPAFIPANQATDGSVEDSMAEGVHVAEFSTTKKLTGLGNDVAPFNEDAKPA